MKKYFVFMVFVLACGILTGGCFAAAKAARRTRRIEPKAGAKVLILGDSISIGYTRQVKELLNGYADVVRATRNGRTQNCGSTWMGLNGLDGWLGDGKWDVIHFNWGLWDLCYRNPKSHGSGRRDKVHGKVTSGIDEYKENLRKIVRRLKKTSAVLIWTTTTPVPEGEEGRFVGDSARYNAAAAEVMREMGVDVVDDLYDAVRSAGTNYYIKPGNVHFTKAGYDYLAEHVAGVIMKELVKTTDIQLNGTIRLWESDAPYAVGKEKKDVPELTVYLPEKWNDKHAAFVICPGGAYVGLAMEHEGEAVAEWLNSIGAAGFVLKYRCKGAGYRYPVPMTDAQRAMRMVRARAQMYGVDAGRVGIIGFSAGGHLASTIGTHFSEFDKNNARAANIIDRQSCRPDFMALIYPVITMTEDFMHRGSRNSLLGPDVDEQLAEKMSNDKHVSSTTPPTFLIHADNDRSVPAQNSIVFYEALKRFKIPAEMHIFNKGGHGFAFRHINEQTDSWPDLCAGWMRVTGIISR